MTSGGRRRETALIAANIALVAVVLLPAYVLIAALLEVVPGSATRGGTGAATYVESVRHHARDRWWVPLLYLFVAPFVSALLVWLAHRRLTSHLRLVAMMAAPLGFLAIFVFLFGQRAGSLEPLLRAALPGVLATLAYAVVMRLPREAPLPAAGAPASERDRRSR